MIWKTHGIHYNDYMNEREMILACLQPATQLRVLKPYNWQTVDKKDTNIIWIHFKQSHNMALLAQYKKIYCNSYKVSWLKDIDFPRVFSYLDG